MDDLRLFCGSVYDVALTLILTVEIVCGFSSLLGDPLLVFTCLNYFVVVVSSVLEGHRKLLAIPSLASQAD